MRRFAVLLLLALVLGAVTQAQAMTKRQEVKRNRIDRWSYVGCRTCPKAVSYASFDAKSVIEKNIKVTGTAEYSTNFGYKPLFWMWESSHSFFEHGHFTKPVQWDTGTGFNSTLWNHWEEVLPRDKHFDGGAGPPPWRYLRANFTFKSCWVGPISCILHSHGWVSITARADANDPFRVGHSNG